MTNCPPISVLIVDDSQRLRDALRQSMAGDARFGKVFEADNGADGLAIFKAHQPDAVVLDFQLPDLNGLEVLKRMKGVEPSAVIVIVTSHEEPEIRQECLRRGADGFIQKASGLPTVAPTLIGLCSSPQRMKSSGIQGRTNSPPDSGEKQRGK